MKVTLSQIAYVIKALNLNNIQRSILINAFANITDGNIEEIEEKLDTLDKEMVDAKNQLDKIDINTVIQELEIGDSSEIKERNLAKLQKVEHTFIVNINYGYGTANWLPASGGSAYVITSNGIKVFYKINADGSVIKIAEQSNALKIIDKNNITTDLFEIIKNSNIIEYNNICYTKSTYFNNGAQEAISFCNTSDNLLIDRIMFSILFANNAITVNQYNYAVKATSTTFGLVKVKGEDILSDGTLVIPTIPNNMLRYFYMIIRETSENSGKYTFNEEPTSDDINNIINDNYCLMFDCGNSFYSYYYPNYELIEDDDNGYVSAIKFSFISTNSGKPILNIFNGSHNLDEDSYTWTYKYIDLSANATKTTPGVVKACTNIANVTDTANLMGAFNNLLEQMRAAGMMI